MNWKSILADIKKTDWKSIWAGDWSLLMCSDWGDFYINEMKVSSRMFMTKVIFLYRQGKVATYIPEKDLVAWSKHLAKYYGSDIEKIKALCDNLKVQADLMRAFMDKNINNINERVYWDYLKADRRYYRSHIQVKYIVDGLSEKLLKKFLPYLEEARVYSEPVFARVIDFDASFAGTLGKKLKIKPEYILAATKDEIRKYFEGKGRLPGKELARRWTRGALVFNKKRMIVVSGRRAEEVEAAMFSTAKSGTIKGQCAFPGQASGKVRIVLDPRKAAGFKKGDILVTAMTRPEYLPLMKKAAAIITDAGGILCHAAITAREIKKPCVISAKVATKILKDGDLVEVDAEKGIVRKL